MAVSTKNSDVSTLCPTLTRVVPDQTEIQTQSLSLDAEGELILYKDSYINHRKFEVRGDRFIFRKRSESYRTDEPFHFQQGELQVWGGSFKNDPLSSEFTDAKLSYCPGEEENVAWWVQSQESTYDAESGKIESYNVSLWFQGIPFLYTPYFSMNTVRASGLLAPSFGFFQAPASNNNTGRESFYASQGIFLNLAPNYDATLYGTYLDERGTLASGEFRYLFEKTHNGEFNIANLANDPILEDQEASDSQRILWKHNGQLDDQLSLEANYVYFAPRNFNQIFPDIFKDRYSASVDRYFRLTYTVPKSYTYVSVQDNISLVDESLDGVQKVPQVENIYYLDRTGNSRVTLNSQATQFRDPAQNAIAPEVTRFVFNPHWRWQYSSLQYQLLTEAGALLNHYEAQQLNNGGSRSFNIANGYIHLGSELYIDNTPDSLRNSMSTTLIPSLHYIYTPYVEQEDIPNLETSRKSITRLEQLYDPLEFNGYDRINDANRVVAALNQTFFVPDSTLFLRTSIGRNINIEQPRLIRSNADSFDNWFVESLLSLNAVSLDVSTQWDEDFEDINFFSSNLLYEQKRYALRANFLRENIMNDIYRFFAFGYSLQLTQNWNIATLTNYNVEQEHLNTLLVGASYDDCCWQFNVFFESQQLVNDRSQERLTELNFELVLKNLSSIGLSNSKENAANRALGLRP